MCTPSVQVWRKRLSQARQAGRPGPEAALALNLMQIMIGPCRDPNDMTCSTSPLFPNVGRRG